MASQCRTTSGIYRRCIIVNNSELCLWTNPSDTKPWLDAKNYCAMNNATLADIIDEQTQGALKDFREDSNSQLGKSAGNWIGVSTGQISSFRWINGQQTAQSE
jgi:hypothetical protein